MKKLDILFEDKDIIVCVKPPGISSQQERGSGEDMVSILMNHQYENGNRTPYVGVVHRLDKMVGGVMVYGKNKKAAAALSKAIAQKSVKKKYYAVLCGKPEKVEDTIINYLKKDGSQNISLVTTREEEGSKKAELSYRIIDTGEFFDGENDIELSLADIELYTGRHHQIRVQFSALGNPLYGDKKYNKNCSFLMREIGLFSYKLEFFHPINGKEMLFEKTPKNGIFKMFF